MRRTLRSCIATLVAAVSLAAGAALPQALPSDLPLRRDAPEAAASGVPWTPALVLLGLAGAAGAYLAWRRGSGKGQPGAARRGEHALSRVSSHPLTQQASVHVVQWNGTEYLVGCTAQQVTLLAQRPLQAQADRVA